MDVLNDWLQERCVPDPKAITPFKDLYDDYCAWCGETDQEPLGKRAFANRLTEKGFEIARLKGDAKARKGLRLKTPADRTDRSDHNSGISPISAANGRNIETSVGSVGSVGSSPPDDDAEIPF
jgi:hypothetical protein